MNRLLMPGRLSMTLPALALLVVPFGCGSETHTTAEVPTPPKIEIGAFEVTPMPGTSPGAVEPPGTLDRQVYQTTGEVGTGELKHDAEKAASDAKKEVRDAEGDVKKAAGEVESEAKDKVKEIEAEARKSAEDALDKLLPAPK